jgi:hypothetical protein
MLKSVSITGLCLVLLVSDLSAQVPDTILIPPDPICRECLLEVTGKVSLGEEDGEGFVDMPSAAARSSGSYFIVNRSLDYEIRVFDLSGRFQRVIGRKGQGPGEFQAIWDLAASTGDSLHVIDLSNQRRTVLSPEFEVVRSHSLPARPIHRGYRPLADGGGILHGRMFDSAGKLRLLHRLDADGHVVTSLGNPVSASTEFRVGPESILRTPVVVDDSTLLVGFWADFRLEEVDLGGRQHRVFLLDGRDWRANTPEGVAGSQPAITDMWLDPERRLWLLVRVGDPNWEDAVVVPRPGLGVRGGVEITDWNGYWDSVVEVIDLEAQRVIARERFPQFFLEFFESGELVSFRMTGQNEAIVEVVQIQLQGPPRPGKE